MVKKHNVELRCCGSTIAVMVDEQAVRAGNPNEIRKTVICKVCDRIVVLSLSDTGNKIRIDQEVV